ncbi:unnamed protein product, partial [Iphiclides podalirius]
MINSERLRVRNTEIDDEIKFVTAGRGEGGHSQSADLGRGHARRTWTLVKRIRLSPGRTDGRPAKAARRPRDRRPIAHPSARRHPALKVTPILADPVRGGQLIGRDNGAIATYGTRRAIPTSRVIGIDATAKLMP